MLADSVEAAVRSMTDKTEAKIEIIIKKIIKDKLDDEQLDMSQLTLTDLNTITNSFMRVLSGYFHAREQYPEINNSIKKDIFIKETGDNNREQANEENLDESKRVGGTKVDNN
jgi:hypothetical protein